MAWFNADDKMHSHPKVRRAGLEAIGLWLVCGTYCTDFLTDGKIPGWFVDSWPRGKTLAKKLIATDFWEADGDDYMFRNWAEYQRTKDRVLKDRARAKERKDAWLARQDRNGR
ncbi:hypothetical protein [Arthrobacter sp. CP30]